MIVEKVIVEMVTVKPEGDIRAGSRRTGSSQGSRRTSYGPDPAPCVDRRAHADTPLISQLFLDNLRQLMHCLVITSLSDI